MEDETFEELLVELIEALEDFLEDLDSEEQSLSAELASTNDTIH